ncbi:MAG: twin-arginine translocation signal domain-containing protein [Candidatus Pacebacteria bacterium]|nr:twin-arginine translocation signal domain-containing protein [Candidatus Paceibacterota bacterium]
MDKNLNKNRRNFLKFLLIGGGTFVAAKVLGPTITKMFDGPTVEGDFTSFRAVENKKGLTIYDKETGEEIFIIDQGE